MGRDASKRKRQQGMALIQASVAVTNTAPIYSSPASSDGDSFLPYRVNNSTELTSISFRRLHEDGTFGDVHPVLPGYAHSLPLRVFNDRIHIRSQVSCLFVIFVCV